MLEDDTAHVGPVARHLILQQTGRYVPFFLHLKQRPLFGGMSSDCCDGIRCGGVFVVGG